MRHVGVRIVALREGETTPVEDNERVARVDWTGKRIYLLILQDPVPSPTKDISTFRPALRDVSLSDGSERRAQWSRKESREHEPALPATSMTPPAR